MLELRPCCENCGKDLPPDAANAMICSFECTFCRVDDVLAGKCPNCKGGFQTRPIRPANLLEKYPPSCERVFKPVKT